MAGLNGYGVVFEIAESGGTTYTPIANVTNVGGPEIERETIDTTAHDSPDGWKEFVGGLKDGGEVSLELNYDPREHDVLLAQFDSDDPINCRLRWPNDIAHWTFKALMTGFSPEGPVDDKLAAETKWQVAGKPTTATGAPAAGGA